MILSAFLTSVGINLGLCFLFFTLYSVLKNQPVNVPVYAPRLYKEHSESQQHRDDFTLERLLPSPGWVKRALQVTDDQLLAISGLDALVFMRIFVFSLRVFTFGVIVGIFILLPVNYLGNQLDDDFSDLPKKSLDSFSISNVNNGSNRLWIHFCAAYIFTAVVCYFLYCEYSYIFSKRIDCFNSSKPQPKQFTVLVRGIPVSAGSSTSETVEKFFTENYPSTYLSNSVVHRTSRLQAIVNEIEKLCKKLTRLKSTNGSEQKLSRSGFLGLFGKKVNLVEHYESKLEDLEVKMKEVAQLSLAREEVSAAFVCFKSRLGAAIALHIQPGINPTEWVTQRAPDPHDVYWPFFSASVVKLWIAKLVVIVAFIALTILFLIPVVLVQGLIHLDQLEKWFPFLKGVLKITLVSEVVTGYLPSLILQMFLSFVPPILVVFSSMQGSNSISKIEISACTQMIVFTIWNIYFANAVSGSALYRVRMFIEPKTIPTILAQAVPAQATFFITYVLSSGWASISSELFRLFPLISWYMTRLFDRKSDHDFEVPQFSYHSVIPRILFFGLVGITYFFLAPLILPFLLIFYCLGYVIYRNQLLTVYEQKYETNGKFWPTVHNTTIFSLILMHVIAIGIFGLKKLPLASSLTIPLPILTLLFNAYCRKRFLPIFKGYPTECMVKRDKEDENDPDMSEFFEKLVKAYQDPVMTRIRSSDNSDNNLNSPLLHSLNV
ncbi:hypothetical protein ACFE04_010788 [Oxalis oulophora]